MRPAVLACCCWEASRSAEILVSARSRSLCRDELSSEAGPGAASQPSARKVRSHDSRRFAAGGSDEEAQNASRSASWSDRLVDLVKFQKRHALVRPVPVLLAVCFIMWEKVRTQGYEETFYFPKAEGVETTHATLGTVCPAPVLLFRSHAVTSAWRRWSIRQGLPETAAAQEESSGRST